MKNSKVLIETIQVADTKAMKEMQKKLNQWMTTGKLRKYEIVPFGAIAVFNICLNK